MKILKKLLFSLEKCMTKCYITLTNKGGIMKNKLRYYREKLNMTQGQLGSKLGVTKQTVWKWENYKAEIHPRHHEKLQKILGISDGDVSNIFCDSVFTPEQKRIQELRDTRLCKKENKQQEIEVVRRSGIEVPVVSEAAAAECNPGIMPLIDCVSQYAEDKIYFSEGKNGDFAIKVVGCSMLPWYPPGTTLLVRPFQDLRNGQRVIAVLDEGEIIFKVFVRGKHKIGLVSINGESGKDYEFPLTGKGIRYLCRVIASQRNEDKIDAACRAAGIHHAWEEKLKNL